MGVQTASTYHVPDVHCKSLLGLGQLKVITTVGFIISPFDGIGIEDVAVVNCQSIRDRYTQLEILVFPRLE